MSEGLRRCGFRRAGLALLASLGFFLTAAPALSQPSQSQINAIRQNCRSDFCRQTIKSARASAAR